MRAKGPIAQRSISTAMIANHYNKYWTYLFFVWTNARAGIWTQDLPDHNQNVTIDVLDRSAMKAGFVHVHWCSVAFWTTNTSPSTRSNWWIYFGAMEEGVYEMN